MQTSPPFPPTADQPLISSWRWAGACAIGTSHSRHGLECQDRAGCRIVQAHGESYLIAVVSDGAGSAAWAGLGATLVRSGILRAAVAYLQEGGRLEGIDEQVAGSWLVGVRQQVQARATRAAARLRDFAATLITALVGPKCAVVLQVGDGAAVLRRADTQEWGVLCWPYHGEYASMTRFVIDEPGPVIEVARVQEAFDRIVVFSDGLEHLVLDTQRRSVPKSFFDRLTHPVADSPVRGRDRRLSRHLRAYLGGAEVCAATDDDKCMVIGVQG